MSLKTACIDLQFLKWRLNFGGPLDIFHLSQQLCMKGSTSGYDQQLCLDIMMTLHTAAFLETSQHIPYFFFFLLLFACVYIGASLATDNRSSFSVSSPATLFRVAIKTKCDLFNPKACEQSQMTCYKSLSFCVLATFDACRMREGESGPADDHCAVKR